MTGIFKKLIAFGGLSAALGGAGFWFLTAPQALETSVAFANAGDASLGEAVFYAGGCASCHAAPGAKGDDKLMLSGGREFPSPFGTFYAPNISPDEENGIGNWSAYDLANAMIKGVSPEGQHYYPAFPYTSYARVKVEDIVDLKAFMDGLPISQRTNQRHELPFPFNIRRGLGLWKLAYLKDAPIVDLSAELARGQYLVEGLGHCGECHTVRDGFGGQKPGAWLAGAPDPEGKGRVPNITPHEDGIGSWSAGDLAYYLETGFTPDFDSVGGLMVDVVENFAHLSTQDRDAVAQYLLAIPDLEDAVPPAPISQ